MNNYNLLSVAEIIALNIATGTEFLIEDGAITKVIIAEKEGE